MFWRPVRIGKRVRIGARSLSAALLCACAPALIPALIAASTPALAQSASPRLRALLAASSSPEASPAPDALSGPSKFIGPGSCAASACHGSIQPTKITRVLQNEYSTWITSDKHPHAYRGLQEALGQQIGKVLKLPEPPENSQRCLVCHALPATESEHARQFDLSDGVSCESCHGPASSWLDKHIQRDSVHSELVSTYRLYDNRNLVKRAEKCLTCHLGAPGMSVDHELIAAGHPDLTFELDSFSAVQPPHWVDKNEDGSPADALYGVRAWAVGQAVQLQQSMLRLARRAGDKKAAWPEFSEMDCMTCHHALTGPQSWRQQSGYFGHRAGDPPYNLSRYVLFRHFAAEIDPRLNEELTAATDRVKSKITSMSPDRTAVEAEANHAAELAGRIIAGVKSASYDAPRTQRLLRSIVDDADAIAFDGERTAEQATMTIDSLYIAEAKAEGQSASTRQAIDGLFQLVNNPSAYNAPQFAAQLRKVRATLR